MRAMLTPSGNDRPGFHSDVSVSELTECDTRAIKASVVSLAPSVVETEDGVMHETQPTPMKPHGARGLEPPDPKSGVQLTEVRKLARKGPKAASRRIEPGEKMQMRPSGLRPNRLEADRVISTFSFDPNLEPSPQNPH